MTTRKSILVLLLSAPFLAAAQNAEKTMLKAFNLNGKTEVQLQLPGTVDVRTWDGTTVKIQIAVSLPNGNSAMLNDLANIGRYNLSARPEGQSLIISADNLAKIIKVKGQDLKENISFLVFVPKSVVIKTFDATTTTAAVAKMNRR